MPLPVVPPTITTALNLVSYRCLQRENFTGEKVVSAIMVAGSIELARAGTHMAEEAAKIAKNFHKLEVFIENTLREYGKVLPPEKLDEIYVAVRTTLNEKSTNFDAILSSCKKAADDLNKLLGAGMFVVRVVAGAVIFGSTTCIAYYITLAISPKNTVVSTTVASTAAAVVSATAVTAPGMAGWAVIGGAGPVLATAVPIFGTIALLPLLTVVLVTAGVATGTALACK